MATRLSRRKIARFFVESVESGRDITELTRMIAGYLIDTKRKKEVGQLVDEIEYYFNQKGLVLVRVFSARELSDTIKNQITTLVKEKTNAKNVELKTEVDASLIGGFKLEFNNEVIDATIYKKISNLRNLV